MHRRGMEGVRVSIPHACLIRKLRQVLADSPDEWRQFCMFCRSLKGRYSGSSFELLSAEELTILSTWASKAR